MTNHTIKFLIERFQRMELHAAHSGREVWRALAKTIAESKAKNLDQLKQEIQELIIVLLPFLPPYAPPINSINQIMIALETAEGEHRDLKEVQHRISSIKDQTTPQDNHRLIANYLIGALPEKVTIYTHTLSETVMGVLLFLHEKGRIKKVLVTESRPNNDGWVTASKLSTAGVETCLTLDAGFPGAVEKSDIMLSGAEIINPDGSVVCKVGIYPAAVFCRTISKPVYIVADTKKFNPFDDCNFNMTPVSLEDMGLRDIPAGLKAAGSYFDITPSEFVTGYATEKGLLTSQDVFIAAKKQPVSNWLKSQLQLNYTVVLGKEEKYE
jgi:translation initiation factor 2B subunit (eIF-2B alpha/beta/delta family)